MNKTPARSPLFHEDRPECSSYKSSKDNPSLWVGNPQQIQVYVESGCQRISKPLLKIREKFIMNSMEHVDHLSLESHLRPLYFTHSLSHGKKKKPNKTYGCSGWKNTVEHITAQCYTHYQVYSKPLDRKYKTIQV